MSETTSTTFELPDFGPVFDQYAADLKKACEG